MSSSFSGDSISILVHPNDLSGARHNGMRKENRFWRRTCCRIWRRVSVEAAPALVRDTVFYAPDELHDAAFPSRTPTQFIKTTPHSPNLVRQGDDFEISFVGMNVSPQDIPAWNKNELLLYSLSNANAGSRSQWVRKMQSADGQAVNMENGYLVSSRVRNEADSSEPKKVGSLNCINAPNMPLKQGDVPLIHFDPLRCGQIHGTEPNSYVTIPASTALYKQFKAQDAVDEKADEQDVSVRFKVLDLDRVNDNQLQVISGLTQVGELVEKGAVAVPYAELISSAFQAAAMVGKRGLQKYSAPDQVFSVDERFRLAEPAKTNGSVQSGSQSGAARSAPNKNDNYLRYGYYFFLEKSVDAKLYSQTRSSSHYVPLLLRRVDLRKRRRKRNDLEYFPLTNVSYVVMRVLPGCAESIQEQKQAMFAADRKRLYTILQAENISGALMRDK